jgi:hypothetical protein
MRLAFQGPDFDEARVTKSNVSTYRAQLPSDRGKPIWKAVLVLVLPWVGRELEIGWTPTLILALP